MDRDAAIRFEPEGHSYTVHGETYTSVTTFKATLFGKFDADAVVARMMASPWWPNNKYYGQTAEEIKDGWAEAGRVACLEGTRMHKSIEDFYNGQPVEDDSPEYQQFLAFAPTVKGKPYRAEWTVYHEGIKLAGTIDMVFVLPDGTLEVYDWKRTKGLVKKGYGNALHPAIAHLPDTNFWQYAVQPLPPHFGGQVRQESQRHGPRLLPPDPTRLPRRARARAGPQRAVLNPFFL